MKATMNGITLEGIPEEILKYQQLQKEKAFHEFYGLPKGTVGGNRWIKDISNSGRAPAYLGEYICYNGQ